MKAQITRKKVNLPKLFFVNSVRAGTSNSLQNIKNSKDIFGSSKCKVTFGFEYIFLTCAVTVSMEKSRQLRKCKMHAN